MVVVGGLVVGVVGGLVVGVGDPWGAIGLVVGVVVGGAVVAVGLVVVGAVAAGVDPGSGGPVGAADAPGCSLATVTPMNAVAPPARTITVLVSRFRRACALARSIGVGRAGPRLMAIPALAERGRVRGRPIGPRCAQRTCRSRRSASTGRWNRRDDNQSSG